jgi:hypothetical protein
MAIFKVKHKASGLFYGPIKESNGSRSGNLSLTGAVYKKKPDFKDPKFNNILVYVSYYSNNDQLKRLIWDNFGIKNGQEKNIKLNPNDWEIIEIDDSASSPEASGIMKAGDFINLITTYASFFRDQEDKPETDKVLTDFVNFVAANQGVDYGIYAEDLAKHKRRIYNPVDSDIILNQVRKIEDFQKALVAVYQNNAHPAAKNLIEDLAVKYGGEFERSIEMHKDDAAIAAI